MKGEKRKYRYVGEVFHDTAGNRSSIVSDSNDRIKAVVFRDINEILMAKEHKRYNNRNSISLYRATRRPRLVFL